MKETKLNDIDPTEKEDESKDWIESLLPAELSKSDRCERCTTSWKTLISQKDQDINTNTTQPHQPSLPQLIWEGCQNKGASTHQQDVSKEDCPVDKEI